MREIRTSGSTRGSGRLAQSCWRRLSLSTLLVKFFYSLQSINFRVSLVEEGIFIRAHLAYVGEVDLAD